MKEIGGYFELELNKGGVPPKNAIKLNTGRNALEYILRVRHYNKVYIPYYTCDVILEPFIKLNIPYEFYHIDENLEPIFEYERIIPQHGFLYTNYFGLKDIFIKKLSINVSNLIIDNAQSFFSKPLLNSDSFYSIRKFFGVSDGAYLFCNKKLEEDLEQDISYKRMSHLLIRLDKSAEEGYTHFIDNENSLINQPIKKISKLTNRILNSIDYNNVQKKRIKNFEYLHRFLKDRNLLKIDKVDTQGPLIYPFWTKNRTIKKKLLEKKIFCATYWPNVSNWCNKESLEVQLTNEIISIPIDQRQGETELKIILKIIKDELKR